MKETTNPGIFHIHIDAKEISKKLWNRVRSELQFYDQSFSGHPEGYEHFEPNAHLTRKLKTGKEFRTTWNTLDDMVSKSDFVGYLEGEYIPVDDLVPERVFDDSVPFPFLVNRRRLNGTPREQFRETEIHLVMDKDKSDSRLVKKLLDAGLYGAFLPKKDYVAAIFTMQGFRKDIGPLRESLTNYLLLAGGAIRGTIKEERAIRYKLFGVSPTDLPEIANEIIYF